MTNKKLGESFQHTILKIAISDPFFAAKISILISPEYFKTHYLSWFFTQIQKYYSKYQTNPGLEYMIDQIQSIRPEEQSNYAKVLQQIMEAPEDSLEYIKEDLKLFVQKSQFIQTYTLAEQAFKMADYEKAFDTVWHGMENLKQIKFTEDDFISEKNVNDFLLSSDKGELERISILGVDKLEPYAGQPSWDGKIPKGGTTAILGVSSAGKTTFCVNISYHLAQNNKKVEYLYIEDPTEDMIT
jgi:ABC-type multidrug transport system fused ATPase/permease subunit